MTDLTAVSLFAGIGGFDLALERSGVRVTAAVEIDDAARGVLADQFPDATLFTDIREVTGDQLRAAGFVPGRGILAAGSPCQDLSVAGHRRGLGEGTRSGLFWEFDRLVAELRPAWIIFENVPGLLSATCPCPGTGEHNGCTEPHSVSGGGCVGGCFPAHGGAMGLVLGALGDRGYGFAYRVLDAQSLGVPQRRRRVIIVGRAGGDPRGPAQVLLEPEGGTGDSAAGGQAGPLVAVAAPGGARAGGTNSTGGGTGGLISGTVSAKWAKGTGGPSGDEAQYLIAFDAAQITSGQNRSNPNPGDPAPSLAATVSPHVAHTLRADPGGTGQAHNTNFVTHTLTGEGHDASEDGTGRGTPIVPVSLAVAGEISTGVDVAQTVRSANGQPGTAVRRLTPTECGRLQGFPDGWTDTSNGKPQSDAARYKQYGNALAVPVGEWVVRRTVAVDAAQRAADSAEANPDVAA